MSKKGWYDFKHRYSSHWRDFWFPIFILVSTIYIIIFFREKISEIVETPLEHGIMLVDIFLFELGLFGVLMVIGAFLKPYRKEDSQKYDCGYRLSPSEARKIEYKTLNDSIWNRSHDHLTVQTILISGSLVAVSVVIEKIPNPQENPMIVRGVLFGALLLIVFAYLWHYTLDKVNEIQWNRIRKLEHLLGIEYGIHGLYDEIKNEGWHRLRTKLWKILLGSLFFLYLLALIFAYIYP